MGAKALMGLLETFPDQIMVMVVQLGKFTEMPLNCTLKMGECYGMQSISQYRYLNNNKILKIIVK